MTDDARNQSRAIQQHNPQGATMELQPHQQRVVDEKADLDVKIEKLGAFFETDIYAKLPRAEQGRLNQQHVVMEMYSLILGERIAAFE